MRPRSRPHCPRAELDRVPPPVGLQVPGAFCGKPRCLAFLCVLKFLKLVPQFRNQSPVTTMNLKPPPLQEGRACLSPSSPNTGRLCFKPVPPGKTRVADRERRGAVVWLWIGHSLGSCSLLRSQSGRLHKESIFHNQTLLVMMTSGWRDPEVHFDSSGKAGCVWPNFMSRSGQFVAL